MKSPYLALFLFDLREFTRNRWLFVYGIAYFLFASLLLHFGGGRPLQAYTSLINLVLLLCPLFSLLFGGISFLDGIPFLELILSRKLARGPVYTVRWLALGSGLSLAAMTGMGLALIFFSTAEGGGTGSLWFLIALTLPLHLLFTALAYPVALVSPGREVLLGILLGIWFYFYILYDLILLGAGYFFGDYPLEIPVLILVLLNPLDLARIVLLFQGELASLIGFGGALFREILGKSYGPPVAFFVLFFWTFFLFLIGLGKFRRRDF